MSTQNLIAKSWRSANLMFLNKFLQSQAVTVNVISQFLKYQGRK